VVFWQIAAFHRESEQGIDKLPVIVLRPTSHAQGPNEIFHLLAAHQRNMDFESICEMTKAALEFLCVNVALACFLFHQDEFVHHFLNRQFRQADRVTFQIKIHDFL